MRKNLTNCSFWKIKLILEGELFSKQNKPWSNYFISLFQLLWVNNSSISEIYYLGVGIITHKVRLTLICLHHILYWWLHSPSSDPICVPAKSSMQQFKREYFCHLPGKPRRRVGHPVPGLILSQAWLLKVLGKWTCRWKFCLLSLILSSFQVG